MNSLHYTFISHGVLYYGQSHRGGFLCVEEGVTKGYGGQDIIQDWIKNFFLKDYCLTK